MIPNQDQMGELTRQILMAVSGYLVGRGWLTADMATTLGGIAATAIPIIWGMVRQTKLGNIVAGANAAKSIDPHAKVVMPNAPEITGSATPANVVAR